MFEVLHDTIYAKKMKSKKIKVGFVNINENTTYHINCSGLIKFVQGNLNKFIMNDLHIKTEFKDLNLRIPGCIDYINQIEEHLKIKKSVFYNINYDDFKIKISIRWIKSPPMLSMFFNMLNLGMYHEPGMEFKATISSAMIRKNINIKNKKQAIDYILKNGDRKAFYRDIRMNYPKKNNLHHFGDLEGYSRQLEISRKKQKVEMPYWCK